MRTFMAQCKAAFVTGLAVVLPAAVSIGVVIWLFGTVANFTDTLLVFLPRGWTHARNGEGPMHLYWSVMALVLAMLLVGLVGKLARYYLGTKLIQLVDMVLMRVPLLNRIYSVLKQINEAFSSNRAATFKKVVLVEFPRPGLYSIGFLTGMHNGEMHAKTGESLVSVFVPTPPLTSGAIVLVPEAEVVKLDMSVADGIKFIMSLGSVSPARPSPAGTLGAGTAGHPKGAGLLRTGEVALTPCVPRAVATLHIPSEDSDDGPSNAPAREMPGTSKNNDTMKPVRT
jgi:uncharacterized membrane protein